jgi:cytochrome P450
MPATKAPPEETPHRDGLAGREPVALSPARSIAQEWRQARRAAPFPPGDRTFSLARARRFMSDPLDMLLEAYARYGPVFTLRISASPAVVALGPEANRAILLSDPDKFRYRDGGMKVLIPLLGDGLLTTDGAYHRRSRKIVQPAFHHERLAAIHDSMAADTRQAVDAWEPGATIRAFPWAHDLVLRVALRGLFGFDPDAVSSAINPRREFEHAFAFYSRSLLWLYVRGPGSPYARMRAARKRLDEIVFAEIARRRRAGTHGDDMLSLLIDATDEDGAPLPDPVVRDEVMTSLTGGQSTAPSICFVLYQLASNPDWQDRVVAELDALGREPTAEDLMRGGLPQLDAVVKEALRLHTPSWVGSRRCIATCDIAGTPVPAGVQLYFSPWVTHRLPDLWDEPDDFRPERFDADETGRIPRGGYIPFGAGSRICLGMRFAELLIRTAACCAVRDFRLEPVPGYRFAVTPRFVLKPTEGLPLRLTPRR